MVRECVELVKMTLAAVLCFAAAGCSLGMDGTLDRTTRDPFAEIPSVRSFNGDYSVALHWTRDEAADEYFLYRAVDNPNPQYQLIYRGLLTEYRDTFELTAADKPFLYRLGKKRGNKQFVDFNSPGKASLGIVSGSIRDFHEPNNSKESATTLSDTTLEANSWFYSSNNIDAVSVYDEDWYYVDIPPHWKATLVLNDRDAPGQSDLNHFMIEQWGLGSEPVETNNPLGFSNTSNSWQRFYVRISPDFEAFRYLYLESNPSLNGGTGGYGKFIRYTITVSQLTQEKS